MPLSPDMVCIDMNWLLAFAVIHLFITATILAAAALNLLEDMDERVVWMGAWIPVLLGIGIAVWKWVLTGDS